MRLRILTVTHKSPGWIEAGYLEYAKRLPSGYAIELIEISAEKRLSQNTDRMTEREGEKMLQLIKPTHHVIALDVKGKEWSTEELAENLATWQQSGNNIDLLIGGPEGLSAACLQRANEKWSLSRLTFPHFLVKVLLAEQLYRAYSILQHHPYHR